MRKAAGALLGDMRSFLTGTSVLADLSSHSDRWLHPIDCAALLADPDSYFGPFDASGIPMQIFPAVGTVYVPSRTAAFGFAHWNALRLGVGDANFHKTAFLSACQWFADFPDGRIEHQFPLLNLAPPWLSALAQGEALSLYARAMLLTSKAQWTEAALAAAQWMTLPVSEGGVLSVLPDGGLFMEEYPGTKHGHVLNGCLYALAGLVDAGEQGLINPGLAEPIAASVESNITGWERRGWSLYQLAQPGGGPLNFNTPSYQIVHMALLRHLGRTMQRPYFVEAADRLGHALDNPALRCWALVNKLRYRAVSGW